ncbi:MAG: cell division protein ZapB [Magnetococcales bacterium]|nr:cell division protein ZapB [Magnetococcales bacterium]
MAMEEMSELSINHNPTTGQPDPIAALEQQWQAMVDAVRRLRKENGDLFAQLQDRTTRLQQAEYELAQVKQSLEGLQQEKSQVTARIEDMLARFNELGHTV